MLVYLSLIETNNDKSKFEIIYLAYRRLMYNRAYRILRNQRDAEDAVHDSFLKIIKHLKKINEPKCPQTRSFVVIVCENTSKDLLKSKTRRPQSELDETIGSFVPEIENFTDSDAISTAIAMLPDKYRDLILLKYDTGLSEHEIAELFSMSFENVKKTIQRAKTKLSQILDEMGVAK